MSSELLEKNFLQATRKTEYNEPLYLQTLTTPESESKEKEAKKKKLWAHMYKDGTT